MDGRQGSTHQVGPEQIRYAAILEQGMYLGLLALFVTFIIYALGIINPYIPLDDVSGYWGLSVHEYLEKTNIRAGWSWLGMLNYGDFINFIGVAILAGVTIICYVAIIPILLKNRDRLYAFFALLEVIVLCLAASGILAGGGH